MKLLKKPNKNDGISYWESMVDLMSALVLLILLIFMLVLLYIVKVPDEVYNSIHKNDGYETEDLIPHEGYGDDWDGEGENDDAGDEGGHGLWDHNGGGGGDEEPQTERETKKGEFESEFIGYEDDGEKTAIHVSLIDGETKKAIKRKGIEFQLFSANAVLQILHTYYPKKMEYKKYATTDTGSFYLPEKIPFGDYYFHELTEPEGYDAAENLTFAVDEYKDWEEPLEITIPLLPSRNVIRLQVNDKKTGVGVSGGVYEVIAAEDIVTQDGTKRASKGTVVDKIVINNNGYGESIPLYLGEYRLEQTKVPSYYAADESALTVNISKKGSKEEKSLENICEKTQVTYTVTDELDASIAMANVSFSLTRDGDLTGAKTVTTDARGKIVLTDLMKDSTYHLQQTSTMDGYLPADTDFSFTVSADGRIGSKTAVDYTITNRLIRIRIGVRDKLLHKYMSDYNVALYDESGYLVNVWDSTGTLKEIEGIEPGYYTLVLKGKKEAGEEIMVMDISEQQDFIISLWSDASIAILGGAAAGIILLLVLVIRRIKRKPKTEE